MSAANNTGFPAIIGTQQDKSSVRLVLKIDPELHWFEGHFPGNPVLPGIVQLHWAATVAVEYLGFKGVPAEIKRLKFKKIVVPPNELQLIVTKHGAAEAQFEFLSGGEQCSLGRLVFTED